GQRVPEDLHPANRRLLVDQAFRRKRETSAFAYADDELPLVMANAARAVPGKELREVLLG
ncbi:MAG: flagellar biosynthesis protein FlhF, partial [Noviherbaspirillum sp.]